MSRKKGHVSVVIDRNVIKELIPHGSYCYKSVKYDKDTGTLHIKKCPFFSLRKATKNNPSLYHGEQAEWCGYLKEYLYIQDQVKDCGVNDE